MLFDVNLLAVIVAALVTIALGFFYYSPYGLGKIWMDSLGTRCKHEDKPTPAHWISMFAVAFLSALALSWLIHWTNPIDLSGGILVALAAWIIVAAKHYSGVIWCKYPIKAYLIDAGWQLLSLVVMAIIITLWR